ncbi:hypothetical protein [Gordonia polyisoprenivorans]|uniref:hypothetical protein n=1 Tax=Gordonia polyisoprenivorans TaxID=84595 RepID=UPI001F0B5F2C|nr:hypothetical protein [Gordonia polyisoprenivorans]UZF55854.1 hypothetical protein LH935_24660 [Gordonia polyisoprenivorans]
MTNSDTMSTKTQIIKGNNPFQVHPDTDLLHPPSWSVPGWSETMFFHVWSPENGVGVFIHCGRWPADLELWWAQTIVMLPDGELLVDRSWGRAPDRRGPATGNLRVECLEPHRRWRLAFDGAGESTDLARMVSGATGAGPAVAVRFDIEITAAAPVWDMHGALGFDNLSWASFHHTQGFIARGRIHTVDQEWLIRGVAVRDHSSGARDVSRLGGLHFFVFVFPETSRVINGLVNWQVDGTVDHRVFTDQLAGTAETGTQTRCTGLTDFRTHEPQRMSVFITRSDGLHEFAAQRLHGYTLTFLAPNENINGVALDTEPDALVVTQSTVRVTGPDGAIGYGVIERDYRPSQLPSPEER